MNKEKGIVNLGYLVTCEMQNGNIIPAFTACFSSAMKMAERFEEGDYTKEVKILKLLTGATFEYIF